MTVRRDVLYPILLLCGSLILALLAAEFAYRGLKGVPLLSTANLLQQRLDLIRTMTGVLVHDPVLGWRLKDDLYTPGIPFTTGRLGVRMNQNEIIPLPRGGILAVGDSFTAGSGVRDEEAWPARLEAVLKQPVVNGAAGAYAVDQMILRAEQLLPDVTPAALIVGILSQDSLRNSYSVYGGGYKPYFEIEDGRAVLKGVPVPLVAAQPLRLGWIREVLGRSHMIDAAVTALNLQERWIDNRLRYRQIHSDKVGVDISCLLMDRLLGLKRDHGLRIVIVMMYGAGEIENSPPPWYASSVVECARRKGLDVIDSYPPIRSILNADREAFVRLWLNEGGQLGHLSAEGNDFIARLLKQTFFGSKD